MLPLVEFPIIVQHYTPWFECVFSPQALVQFQRYLCGLIVSENKTVVGINRLRHQSPLCLRKPQSKQSQPVLDPEPFLGGGAEPTTPGPVEQPGRHLP